MLTNVPGPGVGPPPGAGLPGFPLLLFAEGDPPEEAPPQPAKKSATQVRRRVASKKARSKVLLCIGYNPITFSVGITRSAASCTPEHLPDTRRMRVSGECGRREAQLFASFSAMRSSYNSAKSP